MTLTNLVRRYLNLTPQTSDTFLQTAYHKSAHIVLAYSYGYSCHRVDLKEIENIDIHYKEDLMLVAGIVSYSMDPVLFENLPEYHQRKAGAVTERLINMLTAGYLAQQKSRAGKDEFRQTGEDLLAHPPASIDRLQHFLDNYHGQAGDPFAKTFNIQSLSYFISLPENWRVIENLAKQLLFARGNMLDQHAIEKILHKKPTLKKSFQSSYLHTYNPQPADNYFPRPIPVEIKQLRKN